MAVIVARNVIVKLVPSARSRACLETRWNATTYCGRVLTFSARRGW